MRPMLTYLRDQGVLLTPPPAVANQPMDVAIERYRQYLVQEREARTRDRAPLC